MPSFIRVATQLGMLRRWDGTNSTCFPQHATQMHAHRFVHIDNLCTGIDQFCSYIFCVNDNYNIDGIDPAKSSLLRYSNHSSTAPNMEPHIERKKGQREKHVYFHTSRAVSKGDELLWDYGSQYWALEDKPAEPAEYVHHAEQVDQGAKLLSKAAVSAT